MSDLRPLTDDEAVLLTHVGRWGSDGYPIVRRRREWWIVSFRSVPGFPSPYKTRKAARQQFEAYLDLARERLAAMQKPGEVVLVTGGGVRRVPR